MAFGRNQTVDGAVNVASINIVGEHSGTRVYDVPGGSQESVDFTPHLPDVTLNLR